MIDLSENNLVDEPFDVSPIDVIIDQSELNINGSINDTSDSFNNNFTISKEAMRILFITIAIITILICLTICICIYLKRRRNLKRQKRKDHFLLPDQSDKLSDKKSSQLPITNSLSTNINSTISFNHKQQYDKNNSSSSIKQSSSNISTNKITTVRPYYYDNLDDIPFIDESRPTSFIDITRI